MRPVDLGPCGGGPSGRLSLAAIRGSEGCFACKNRDYMRVDGWDRFMCRAVGSQLSEDTDL
jgi:hypothetical protein